MKTLLGHLSETEKIEATNILTGWSQSLNIKAESYPTYSKQHLVNCALM